MFLGFRHIKFFLEIFWSIFSVRSIIQLFCWKNSNSKNTLKAPIMFVWTALNKKMKFFNHKIILQSILWRIFMKFSNKSFDGFWYCWKIWFLLTLFWIERLVSSFKSLHSFYSHSKSMKLSFDEKFTFDVFLWPT